MQPSRRVRGDDPLDDRRRDRGDRGAAGRDPDDRAGGAVGGARAPPRAHHHAQAGAGRRADPRRAAGRRAGRPPRPALARPRSHPCACPASPPTSRRCAPRATCGCSSRGNVVSGLGTQAALVALPYQLYVETRLGVPDRPARRGRARAADRRWRCSAARSPTATTAGGCCSLDQVALVVAAPGCSRCCAFAGDAADRGCCTSSAGCSRASARSRTSSRSAIVPNLVAPEPSAPALALNFGLYQLTLVDRPGARRPADRRARASAPPTPSTP